MSIAKSELLKIQGKSDVARKQAVTVRVTIQTIFVPSDIHPWHHTTSYHTQSYDDVTCYAIYDIDL